MKTKNIIYTFIDAVASEMKTDFPEKNYPIVYIGSEGKSYYKPSNNTICIAEKDCHNGITLAEEVMHWIRGQFSETDTDDIIKESIVQEFFGRLGEEFFRELFKGTEYEKLFWKDRRNIRSLVNKSETFRTHIRKTWKKIHRADNDFKRNCRRIAKFSKKMEKQLEKAYGRFTSGKYSADRYFTEVQNILKDIREIDAICEFFPYEFTTASIKNLLFYKQLFDEMDTYADGSEEYKQFFQKMIREVGEKSKEIIEAIELDLDALGAIRVANKFSIQLAIANNEVHRQGYVAAEEFIENNADWLQRIPELLHRTNEEIYEKYISH